MGFEYITGPNLSVGTLTAAVPSGVMLQSQYAETTAFIVATSSMAGAADTVPIKTDGTEIVTVNITPNAVSNNLLITGL